MLGRARRALRAAAATRRARHRELPEALRRRVAALEERLRRPVLVRAARWPDLALRGRITQRAGTLVIEYRDPGAGYFWAYDLLAELLSYAERGHWELTARDRPPAAGHRRERGRNA
jgi:hypothetical protein